MIRSTKVFLTNLALLGALIGFSACQPGEEVEEPGRDEVQIEGDADTLRAEAVAYWGDRGRVGEWRTADGEILFGELKEVRETGDSETVVLGLEEDRVEEVPMEALALEYRHKAWMWQLELDILRPVAWVYVPVFSPGRVPVDKALESWWRSVAEARPELEESPVNVTVVGSGEIPQVHAEHWHGMRAVQILDMLGNMVLARGEFDWAYLPESHEVIFGPIEVLADVAEYNEKERILGHHRERVAHLEAELGLSREAEVIITRPE